MKLKATKNQLINRASKMVKPYLSAKNAFVSSPTPHTQELLEYNITRLQNMPRRLGSGIYYYIHSVFHFRRPSKQ